MSGARSGNAEALSYTGQAEQTPVYLLVWDAPNIDMGLGSLLGGRPDAVHRPRFDAVGRWLIDEARDASGEAVELTPEATVFTNVAPGSAEQIRGWVDALRNVGFAVFAKPKLTEDSDVDPDMLEHIRRRRDEGVLDGLVVASADGQNFRELLEELAGEIPVTVLGFHEHAHWAVENETIGFLDLEDIPGVFRAPLPRVNLDSLPDDGAWLQPYRPLSALVR
ncbi:MULTISPECIES: NYN domain-containing protein [unclassified Corynebacterium]|uniref:NYN domain-containing protein n=1 Tax=unclassified Corynebacterium TaxID=2624378 RepID=UPI002649DB94|nr:NYN domain-containing protein [Corynebacterium sp.]MDN5582228.1 NYN domain-containing protein [Corynebacterium sp.]MDN5718533.1 NYN domain-containing protein [Corynebacterium sp.]MDN6259114.1 NYN domain-containing protein [Corynebacterium sp.]MDN6325851.1 NYN domain-containing protein [Corynebacterium sp.]MDN6386343.1 NYN domain-containing protein [Corynebacterium sp.]